MKYHQITNEELEDWNDGTAAASRDDSTITVKASWVNALVCEVQNRRRLNPDLVFKSGPNTFEKKE